MSKRRAEAVAMMNAESNKFRLRAERAEAAIQRVRELAEHAISIVSRGCACSGDDCTGKCRRGEPMGWDLDPAQVLAALDGESDD